MKIKNSKLKIICYKEIKKNIKTKDMKYNKIKKKRKKIYF
jgi:hypothetical protein